MYKLQQNYRSTKAILSLANASIAHNARRKGKTLHTQNPEGDAPVFYEADEEAGEALYCAKKIAELSRCGYKPSDFAVLMRINALTRSYEQEFTKYGIPYKVFGGFKFFERKEIKDILAYLRVAGNPFDSEAVARIINVPRRGIGERTLDALYDYAAREDVPLFDAVLDHDKLGVGSSAQAKLRAFGAYLKEIVLEAQTMAVDEFVRRLVDTSGMRGQYADKSDESVTKLANIEEFLNSVDEFVRMNPEATLSDYLQQITLYSDTDEMDGSDYVTIATIHAVKGLEFKCVFVVGLEENIMPTSRAADDPAGLEEERRLMYVAITRAQEKLFLTRSKSRYLYGKREPTMRSRFVRELEGELDVAPETQRASYGYGYGGAPYGTRAAYGGSRPSGAGQYARSYGAAQERPAAESRSTFGAGSRPSGNVRFGNAGRTAPVQPRKDTSGFAVGTRVRHARFGEGVVTAMRGAGGNVIVTVRFDQAGNKDLAAALAPLEIIG